MVKLSFTAEYAGLLFLLNGLIILVFLYGRKKKKERVMQFGNFETLKKVSGDRILSSSDVILVMRILAISSLIIGLSSPVIINEEKGAGFNFVVAMDVSGSMFTDDVDPSRIEAAKNSIKNFISELGSTSRIGFITYGGEVSKDQELTRNREKLKSAVNSAGIGEGGGTATGDAVAASVTMLTGRDKLGKVILVTDGISTVGQSINESASFAKRQNVTVNTIGIGETTGENPEFGTINGRNASGMDFPNLNSEALNRLSDKTGGEAVFVSDSESLKEAFIDLEEREAQNSISEILFLIAGILLVLESVIRTTDIRVIP
jgi:Ca-activated chloride channel family protein